MILSILTKLFKIVATCNLGQCTDCHKAGLGQTVSKIKNKMANARFIGMTNQFGENQTIFAKQV
jgi:hypothetical protein